MGFVVRACLSLSYLFWCDFAHQLLKCCFTSSWGSFRGNCSAWSWGVRVSVDGGGLRIAPWHPLEREPPAALLSLTQDINKSSRLARSRSEGLGSLWPYHPECSWSCLRGWEELPHCPSLPLTYMWACTVYWGAEESISGLQVKRGHPAGPDHTDTRCSWVLLGTETEKQVCSWLENPSDTADAKQKKRVILCSWSAVGQMELTHCFVGPSREAEAFPSLHTCLLMVLSPWQTDGMEHIRVHFHLSGFSSSIHYQWQFDFSGSPWSRLNSSVIFSQRTVCSSFTALTTFVTTHIVLLTAFSLGVQGTTVPQHLVWPLVQSRGPIQICYWSGRTRGGADILFFFFFFQKNEWFTLGFLSKLHLKVKTKFLTKTTIQKWKLSFPVT